MRSVRRDVNRLASSYRLLDAAECKLQFTFQQGKRLFEVMAMRWRASSPRNVHIDQAIPPGSIFSREKNGVGVSDNPDVRKFSIRVGASDRQGALQIIGRNRHIGMLGLVGFTVHGTTPWWLDDVLCLEVGER